MYEDGDSDSIQDEVGTAGKCAFVFREFESK